MKSNLKMLNIRTSLLLIILFLLPALCLAQESTASIASPESPETSSSIKLSEVAAPAATEKPYNLTMIVSQSANLYKLEDKENRASATDVDMRPSLKLNDQLTALSQLVVSRDEVQQGNVSVSNLLLGLRVKGPELANQVLSSATLSAVAPTSETSQKVDRLQGAFGLGGKLTKEWTRVSVSYLAAIRQNVHEFNFNAEGSANVQYTLRQDMTFDFPINDKWSVGLGGYYRQGWTYGGSSRQNYGAEIGASYQLSKILSASLSTSNEGSALKPNGSETNVKVYDENTSTFSASLTLSI